MFFCSGPSYECVSSSRICFLETNTMNILRMAFVNPCNGTASFAKQSPAWIKHKAMKINFQYRVREKYEMVLYILGSGIANG